MVYEPVNLGNQDAGAGLIGFEIVASPLESLASLFSFSDFSVCFSICLSFAVGDKLHLDDQQFLCRGNEIPTAMRFHPYQSELVVSDKQGIT